MADGPHQPQWRWWLAFVIIPIVAAAITIYPNISEWFSRAEPSADHRDGQQTPDKEPIAIGANIRPITDPPVTTGEPAPAPDQPDLANGDRADRWGRYCALSRSERLKVVRVSAVQVAELVEWRRARIKGMADLDCSWIGSGGERTAYTGTVAEDKLCWRFCCPGQGVGDPGCP